jgi:hypothetical protein
MCDLLAPYIAWSTEELRWYSSGYLETRRFLCFTVRKAQMIPSVCEHHQTKHFCVYQNLIQQHNLQDANQGLMTLQKLLQAQ